MSAKALELSQDIIPQRRPGSGEVIRSYRREDREAVRDICRKTGQKGNPTRIFLEDEEIAPMLLADYYLDYEPESCFVAAVEGRVVGYLLGCLNTRRQIFISATRIYPRVALRVLWNLVTLEYRDRMTYRTLWWIISRSWREAHVPDLARYPGHAHFNLDVSCRSRGLGDRLSRAFRFRAVEKGIRGMHVVIREMKGDDRLSAYLCRERGYRIIAVKPFTLWQHVTGRKWETKLLVCDFSDLHRKKSRVPFEP